MLRIKSLVVTDFGPFKGEQRLDFRPEDGVTIISGQNGRGKSLLLNAIRYALFGRVLGRTGSPRDLADVTNWEQSALDSATPFKVVVDLDVDGVPYHVTRIHHPAEDRSEMLLARDGSLLALETAERALEQILPEQIARFFLFDGELLRQYEELAADPSKGDELKAAIERILGLPALTNARTDLSTLLGQTNTQLAAAARTRDQTRDLGEHIAMAQDRLDRAQESVGVLSSQLEKLERELAAAESDMERTERQRATIAKRSHLKERRSRDQAALGEARASRASVLTEAWRAMLFPSVTALVGTLNLELGALNERRRAIASAIALREQRQQAIDDGRCPTCGHHLSRDEVSRFSAGPDERGADTTEIDERAARLTAQRDRLSRLAEPSIAGRIEAAEDAVDRIVVAIADIDAEMSTLNDQLDPDANLGSRELEIRWANLNRSIDNTRARRDDARAEIDEQETAIRQLRDKLARLGVPETDRFERKATLFAALGDLFRESVDVYRERLKSDVEREASMIFARLSSESEYKRLQINDGYGLQIVHEDGTIITERSAGYEHLVALSLLGALQRSAPLQGPVIMDSPFGRLDPEHTAKVIAALPALSPQVILLAYENEFDRDQAARALGSRLLSEKELVRVSSRHTIIGDRGGM
ncbi:MAG: AAA family ATPase [Chloroflexi bacterium]|nr:AAA family ATPase [Chloroflexota bacterium]